MPPSVIISFSRSSSVCLNCVNKLMTEPNTATDIPAMTIVLVPVPSHTMMSGANADFGRLFRMTNDGSKISANGFENHKIDDIKTVKNMTRKKLRIVSNKVHPICVNNSPVVIDL